MTPIGYQSETGSFTSPRDIRDSLLLFSRSARYYRDIDLWNHSLHVAEHLIRDPLKLVICCRPSVWDLQLSMQPLLALPSPETLEYSYTGSQPARSSLSASARNRLLPRFRSL